MIEAILSLAERFGVLVRFVDPRYTSVSGWAKYNHLGLNPDTAAAFAIARKGILSKTSDGTLGWGKKGKEFVEVARRMERHDKNDRVGRVLASAEAKKLADAEKAKRAKAEAAAFFGLKAPKTKAKTAKISKKDKAKNNGSPKGQSRDSVAANAPGQGVDESPELASQVPRSRAGSGSEWGIVAKVLGRSRKHWAAKLKAACQPGVKTASRTKTAGVSRPGASSEKRQGELFGGRAVPGGEAYGLGHDVHAFNRYG
jgi:hypothetical protein